jgi:hypothetical protein
MELGAMVDLWNAVRRSLGLAVVALLALAVAGCEVFSITLF